MQSAGKRSKEREKVVLKQVKQGVRSLNSMGVVEALVPVKGADVGQALPPHKYQGQG